MSEVTWPAFKRQTVKAHVRDYSFPHLCLLSYDALQKQQSFIHYETRVFNGVKLVPQRRMCSSAWMWSRTTGRGCMFGLKDFWCIDLCVCVLLSCSLTPPWLSGWTCRSCYHFCPIRPSTTFIPRLLFPSKPDTSWQNGSRAKDGMRRVPPVLLPKPVNAITVLCCSQGRLYVGQCGAENPGWDSVQRGPENAAVDGAPEHQRGGPDEADADQQEHGTAPAAGGIHGRL